VDEIQVLQGKKNTVQKSGSNNVKETKCYYKSFSVNSKHKEVIFK